MRSKTSFTNAPKKALSVYLHPMLARVLCREVPRPIQSVGAVEHNALPGQRLRQILHGFRLPGPGRTLRGGAHVVVQRPRTREVRPLSEPRRARCNPKSKATTNPSTLTENTHTKKTVCYCIRERERGRLYVVALAIRIRPLHLQIAPTTTSRGVFPRYS